MSARLTVPRAVLLLGVVALAGLPRMAQEPATQQPSLRAAVEAAPGQIVVAPPPVAIASKAAPRPAALLPMYGSYIGLQALDIHSTRSALRAGSGREGNPVMQGVAGSSAGLIAVKAASAAGVIWGAEKLSKKHRLAAVLMMAGVNAATAWIVVRNYEIAGR